jgi:hypothetical protein
MVEWRVLWSSSRLGLLPVALQPYSPSWLYSCSCSAPQPQKWQLVQRSFCCGTLDRLQVFWITFDHSSRRDRPGQCLLKTGLARNHPQNREFGGVLYSRPSNCPSRAAARSVKRPPAFPRAALSLRRLAILRGVRRVGAGGREF